MSDKFHLIMNSVDDDLLEEAMTPVRRKRYMPWVATTVAAGLLVVLALPLFQQAKPAAPNESLASLGVEEPLPVIQPLEPAVTQEKPAAPDADENVPQPEAMEPAVTLADLAAIGFDMTLPEAAEDITYEIVTLGNHEGAKASFSIGNTAYVYQAEKAAEPQSGEPAEGAQVLSWHAADLDLRLASASGSASVSWYTPEDQTMWSLTADADSLELLTTASQILGATGLNVTVAPEGAEVISYNAFAMDDLTVAETTFLLDGVACSYRMAATMELEEDFADISGMDGTFAEYAEGEVFWCAAKLSFNEGGEGKIIWFDIVPGLLYSLSMENGASETALLDLANTLFDPAQGND